MFTSPEIARAVQDDRHRAIAGAAIGRLALAARACCAAPANLIARIVRLVRPVPAAC